MNEPVPLMTAVDKRKASARMILADAERGLQVDPLVRMWARQLLEMNPDRPVMLTVCTACGGSGEILLDECAACGGTGMHRETIPAGAGEAMGVLDVPGLPEAGLAAQGAITAAAESKGPQA